MLFSEPKKRKSLAARVRRLKTILAKRKQKEEKRKEKERLQKEYEALKKQLRML